MSKSLNIYPFENAEGAIRFGIQAAIFLVGLFVVHQFIIKPAMRLYDERQRRTSGVTKSAQQDQRRAEQLKDDYTKQYEEKLEEIRKLRSNEIQAAVTKANQAIHHAHEEANHYLQDARSRVEKEIEKAKAEIPSRIPHLTKVISQKIGLSFLFAMGGFELFRGVSAHAEEQLGLIPSFQYSVFWPYFQFVCFLFAIVYFARKPISQMLQSRRDELRARLSEAHEAVLVAERKVKEYELKLSSLENEILDIKQRTMSDARLESEKILLDAKKLSDSILKDAKRISKELVAHGQEELRQEMARLALTEFQNSLNDEKLAHLDSRYKQEALSLANKLN